MHADSSSRGGTCARHRLSSALQTSLARALRIVRQTVSGFLQTETEKPALRAPPADLVCAGPSSRGLCGDVCSLAHAAFALAASLQKLEYIDDLMHELAGTKPRNRTRTKVEPISEIKTTLREHYRRKREKYNFDWPAVYDRDLLRIFSNDPAHQKRPSAASFLRSVRREVRQIVAEGTGVHQYTIDHVLENMIDRCKDLKLRVATPLREARRRVMIVLTVQVMNVLHSGYHRIAV